MTTPNLLATQLMQALARGDKGTAAGLLRDARMPALRQALSELPALQAQLKQVSQAASEGDVRHGVQGHAQAAQQALRAHGRRPTVEMGDAPGSLRWLLVVVLFLGLLGWCLRAGL